MARKTYRNRPELERTGTGGIPPWMLGAGLACAALLVVMAVMRSRTPETYGPPPYDLARIYPMVADPTVEAAAAPEPVAVSRVSRPVRREPVAAPVADPSPGAPFEVSVADAPAEPPAAPSPAAETAAAPVAETTG